MFTIYKVRCNSSVCLSVQRAVTKFAMNWCDHCGFYGMTFLSCTLECKPYEFYAVLEKNQMQAKKYLQNTVTPDPTERLLVYDQMGLFSHTILTVELQNC